MYTWGAIAKELHNTALKHGGIPQFDTIRHRHLAELAKFTQRNVILYVSEFTGGGSQSSAVSIIDEDIQGLMEVLHGLQGTAVDLIIHSPGGSIEAAEAFVEYLRSKFDDVRVVVPQLALSAATMIACSANIVVMGKHSYLGPIDPQIVLPTPLGQRMVPVQAITSQFDRAIEICKDQTRKSEFAAWFPMLAQYGPDLLVRCEAISDLSEQLVCEWLNKYMFNREANGSVSASKIAGWLGKHENFKTHGRHITRHELERQGLKIERLESNQEMQDRFLGVFHATTLTLNGTAAIKIIENQHGHAYIKQKMQQIMPARPQRP